MKNHHPALLLALSLASPSAFAGMQDFSVLNLTPDTKGTTCGVSRYAIDPTGSTVTWDPAAANRFGIPYVPFSPEIYH